MKGKRGSHAGEFPDVLATGGRDSVVNIYDRRYSKKRRWWSFFHLDRTSVVLLSLQRERCIPSIRLPVPIAVRQPCRRQHAYATREEEDRLSSLSLVSSSRKILGVSRPWSSKTNTISTRAPVPIGKTNPTASENLLSFGILQCYQSLGSSPYLFPLQHQSHAQAETDIQCAQRRCQVHQPSRWLLRHENGFVAYDSLRQLYK